MKIIFGLDEFSLKHLKFNSFSLSNFLGSFGKKTVYKWKNPNQILNSYLTPKGVYQARRIYYQYLEKTLDQFTSVSYVCSSLDRTIETLIKV